MPTYIEMDEARKTLGSRALSFEVAVALDMLFDANIPGVPQDPEHYTGNVDYYLAVAWLERVEAGEEWAADFVRRRCRRSREFYSTWEPLVPGAAGHPAWADVLQLEARLCQHLGMRVDTLMNLRKA